MPLPKLVIVTGSSDPFRTAHYWSSWRYRACHDDLPIIMVANGVGTKFNVHEAEWVETIRNNTVLGQAGDVITAVDEYLGVVPAFHAACEVALRSSDAEIFCCFHDDLQIREANWDLVVADHFDRHPQCDLAGFGGAMGVGVDGMYDKDVEFQPSMLGRRDFGSNMLDARTHGDLWSSPRQVAVLDGFSMIFRRRFLELDASANIFTRLTALGMIHHAYDVAISGLAHEQGRETWFLPIMCHHGGGQTAVGDPGYQNWAKTTRPHGDQDFWEESHRITYDLMRGILPFSVDPPGKPAPVISHVVYPLGDAE